MSLSSPGRLFWPLVVTLMFNLSQGSSQVYSNSTQVCPPSWRHVGRSCYGVFVYTNPARDDRTWTGARMNCMLMGGDLVSVNDAVEGYRLDTMRREYGVDDTRFYWVGLHDSAREGWFEWVDGSNVTFSRWHIGEPTSLNPTNALSAIENYVVASGTKNWNDVRNDWSAVINGCDEPYAYICEKVITTSSMPSDPPMDLDTLKEELKGAQGPPGRAGIPGRAGPPGKSGPTGPTGPVGQKGRAGNPGAPGMAGPRGLPGVRGLMGTAGPPGQRGYQGMPGEKGKAGDQGKVGLPGINGKSGNPGPPGQVGPPGKQGWNGEKGDRGEPGAQGVRGLMGPEGKPGASGLPGPSGKGGPEGPRGPPGFIGPIGPRGFPGLQGSKGERGDQGDKGDKGDKGDLGPPGIAGALGEPGPPGEPGTPGTIGVAGRSGFPGLSGQKGEKGDPGDTGRQGFPGMDGLSGKQGEPGPTGEPGPMGPEGRPGEPGPEGPPGSPGQNGVQGSRGEVGLPGPPGAPGPMLRVSTPSLGSLPGQENSYRPNGGYKMDSAFINATAFCRGRASGVYSHPLHCWQFVTCGPSFGGDFEHTCYSGRRFVQRHGECIIDKTCIFGAPTMKAWARSYQAALTAPLEGSGTLLERIRESLAFHSAAMVIVFIMVACLSIMVGRLYYTTRGHYRLRTSQRHAII